MDYFLLITAISLLVLTVIVGWGLTLLGLPGNFQKELTGLENIRLAGLYQGLSRRDVERRVPEIVAFSGIGAAVHQLLRTYSSGMVARLAFASATASRPDVLLVDETLSVGDREFRQRCATRIGELVAHARVVCVCSHEAAIIRRLCTRVIWLEEGQVVADGPTQDVLQQYDAHHQSGGSVKVVSAS